MKPPYMKPCEHCGSEEKVCGMMYYKKPIVVNAFRLGYQAFPGWFYCEWPHSIHQNLKAIMISDENRIEAIIKTPEGEMKACYGDYIVRGIEGEIYPVKATIFEKTYERLDCYGDYTVRGIACEECGHSYEENGVLRCPYSTVDLNPNGYCHRWVIGNNEKRSD